MQTPETTTEDAAPEFRGSATYCPEDNKLRLYVGRVPREDYLKLRAAGWVATPKQREAGGCDFVAPWTPERRDLCLDWCGSIEDEDQSPAERAADRAERFAGYRDKRTGEATGHADRYDAGPSVHGFQSQARAERAAARHDRIADRAGDAWSKAEYWTRRTAGVISHALYRSAPGVRMGRIKTLEAELRRLEAAYDSRGESASGWALDWLNHYRLRLAYENQMLEAQGGRLAHVEIEVGGRIGSKLVIKVNKSTATGRVTSVSLLGPRVEGWAYQVTNIPGTEFAEYQFETERMRPDAYTPPDDESRAELAAFIKTRKAGRDAVVPKAPPLINPTDEDAERLQSVWNAANRAKGEARKARDKYAYCPELEGEPSTVLRITQATYSANSGGTYSRAETVAVCAGGVQEPTFYSYNGHLGKPVCKVRQTSGKNYMADRVIVITDKPQKPLPAAVWQKPIVAALVNASESLAAK